MSYDPSILHKQYKEMLPVWEKCRDCVIGARAVKAKGSLYLPRLGGQESDNDQGYKNYKDRARFFNAPYRTIETMVGHVFRKQPTIELDVLEEYKPDINMAGLSLEGFSMDCLEQALEVSRAGILVDHPPQEQSETKLTVDQAKAKGLRPYLTLYQAESIRYWRMDRVNNATVLVRLCLGEVYEDDKGEEKLQIRELLLENGAYVIRLWSEAADEGQWIQVGGDIIPTMDGKPLDFIPFYFIAPREGGPDVQKPKIEELAEASIGYYRNSADYENALHVAGVPTPWISGINDPKDPAFDELHLGADTFIKLPQGGEAGFLQTGAEGLAGLKEATQEKRVEMAALGGTFLESDKRQAESGEAHAHKRSGENSVLATLAAAVDATIQKALRQAAKWAGGNPEKVVFEFNKDFLPTPMDAGTLTAMVNAWQSGAISYETLFNAIVAGEMITEGHTAQDELDKIAEEPPPLGTVVDLTT